MADQASIRLDCASTFMSSRPRHIVKLVKMAAPKIISAPSRALSNRFGVGMLHDHWMETSSISVTPETICATSAKVAARFHCMRAAISARMTAVARPLATSMLAIAVPLLRSTISIQAPAMNQVAARPRNQAAARGNSCSLPSSSFWARKLVAMKKAVPARIRKPSHRLDCLAAC